MRDNKRRVAVRYGEAKQWTLARSSLPLACPAPLPPPSCSRRELSAMPMPFINLEISPKLEDGAPPPGTMCASPHLIMSGRIKQLPVENVGEESDPGVHYKFGESNHPELALTMKREDFFLRVLIPRTPSLMTMAHEPVSILKTHRVAFLVMVIIMYIATSQRQPSELNHKF